MIILKLLKALVGGYLALTAIALGIIGFGTICHRVRRYPDEGAFECAGNVMQDAINDIRC